MKLYNVNITSILVVRGPWRIFLNFILHNYYFWILYFTTTIWDTMNIQKVIASICNAYYCYFLKKNTLPLMLLWLIFFIKKDVFFGWKAEEIIRRLWRTPRNWIPWWTPRWRGGPGFGIFFKWICQWQENQRPHGEFEMHISKA